MSLTAELFLVRRFPFPRNPLRRLLCTEVTDVGWVGTTWRAEHPIPGAVTYHIHRQMVVMLVILLAEHRHSRELITGCDPGVPRREHILMDLYV